MNYFIYNQVTGEVALNGATLAFGYSGLPPYKNDPKSEALKGLGPLPRGAYICGAGYQHPDLGPDAIPLTPTRFTEQFGRSEFFIHGDSLAHPGLASHGCVILPPTIRAQFKPGDILLVFA